MNEINRPSCKPMASISLDLDDKWTYLKSNGDSSWKKYPSYLPIILPRIFNYLNKHEQKITFFLVGKDAELERNHSLFKKIVSQGHEIGNHSYNHDQWMHKYDREKINYEIQKAHECIAKATGIGPVGYRGPGYSFSNTIAQILVKKKYLYDGSIWSSFMGPVAYLYFSLTSNFNKLDKEQKRGLFGSWKDITRPNQPFYWEVQSKRLLEIPVTTTPYFRFPIHATYILFIYQKNKRLAKLIFNQSLKLCLRNKIQPSILLHPPDFIGKEDNLGLDFMPIMKINHKIKLECLDYILNSTKKHFQVVTMKKHAAHLSSRQITGKTRLKTYDINHFFK